MHQSFIQFVLQDLLSQRSIIENNLYILPSKRSGVFLKHYLSKTLGKTIFSPQILSIEDFVQQVSGLKKASNIELLLILFESYRNLQTENPDDFDTFLRWGETLLQDFNEIDRYLLPAHEILNYLKSIKELDHWSLQPKKTKMVKNYLDFWENIEALYHDFNNRLRSKNIAHQGLIYRVAAKQIASFAENNIKSPLVFMGFNALNTAESQIMQHLLANSECEVYWDIDAYFLDDAVHDAGLFIRRYISEWPYYSKNKPKGIHESFLTQKNIELTGVPKSISQTKYVAHLLQKYTSLHSATPNNLAVVLADESLLFPLAKSIPTEIQDINITMGYYLRNTLLYSFFISVFELIEGKKARGWYYKNILPFLNNPYFKKATETKNSHFVSKLTHSIKSDSTTYVSSESLSRYFDSASIDFGLFPSNEITPSSLIEYCLSFIAQLKKIFQREKNAMELQYLYTFHNLFLQLKTQINQVGFVKNIRTVHAFFKQLATTESMDFIGSPIGGLQLMGVLESRTLDFETVIITSVNEGILPAGKSNSSFIPFDVKREYGLPTYKEKDAIYTYHFYRLIQRAKNVHIIYNTEPDVLEGGEKSRLVSQLLTDSNVKSFVSHNIASPRVQIESQKPYEITKTELLLSNLKELAVNGYSPTSLTNYIRNPIDFYKKHVLKLQDSIEIQENIAANTFGTIIHETLFLLYQPYLGAVLDKDSVASIQAHIEPCIRQSFQKLLPQVDISKGRYLLIFHVVERYVQNFIRLEVRQVENHVIKLLHLEERFETTLNFDEIPHPIKLKGFIDRIDEFDGTVRVIDYKTGNTDAANVRITKWEEILTNDSKSKAFQLLCYAYLIQESHKTQAITAGIYAMRNLKSGFLQFSHNRNPFIDQEILDTFLEQLKVLLLEIYNPEIPFKEKE